MQTAVPVNSIRRKPLKIAPMPSPAVPSAYPTPLPDVSGEKRRPQFEPRVLFNRQIQGSSLEWYTWSGLTRDAGILRMSEFKNTMSRVCNRGDFPADISNIWANSLTSSLTPYSVSSGRGRSNEA